MASNANFDKFLTPEAMVTPGVAGSMSMMIGNALHFNFNVPNGWAVLILSFAFGLLVMAKSEPMLKRTVLYVINSLVIFCVAAGTITLGANGASQQTASAFMLIQPAYAQQSAADLQAEYKQLSVQHDAIWAKITAAPKGADNTQLLNDLQQVDRQRTAVVNSIAAAANAKTTIVAPPGKTFFSPLKF
jgi:hypothetical protein